MQWDVVQSFFFFSLSTDKDLKNRKEEREGKKFDALVFLFMIYVRPST